MKVYRTLIFVIFLSFLSFYSVGCGKNKSDNSKKIIKNTEITFETTKTEEITSNIEYSSGNSEKQTIINESDKKTNQKTEQHQYNDIVLPEERLENDTVKSEENNKSDNPKETETIKNKVSETVTSTTKISEKSKSTTVKTTTKQVKTEKRIELPEVNF
ncbi:MAG: hypothetical protein PUB76_02945 [Oscillospiraceae bacterium]|nr:hypothetical protein [Oscillospiraceae bacterium]MDY3257886.1 hypothetical protein [Ruminococcus callidus]